MRGTADAMKLLQYTVTPNIRVLGNPGREAGVTAWALLHKIYHNDQ